MNASKTTLESVTPRNICLTRLSARERQVLREVIEGKDSREIGAVLDISSLTVKKHLEHIYKKLEVHSRIALVLDYPAPHDFGEAP